MWMNMTLLLESVFPVIPKRAVKALKFASSRGAKVVAITDSVLSPLADPAEFLLLARSEMASFVDSLVAPAQFN